MSGVQYPSSIVWSIYDFKRTGGFAETGIQTQVARLRANDRVRYRTVAKLNINLLASIQNRSYIFGRDRKLGTPVRKSRKTPLDKSVSLSTRPKLLVF